AGEGAVTPRQPGGIDSDGAEEAAENLTHQVSLPGLVAPFRPALVRVSTLVFTRRLDSGRGSLECGLAGRCPEGSPRRRPRSVPGRSADGPACRPDGGRTGGVLLCGGRLPVTPAR